MDAPVSTTRIPPLPHPVQTELLPVTGQTAFAEYRTAYRNDSVHMPEVSLRYLIALVLSDAPQEQVQQFCCQVRTELNDQRLALFIKRYGTEG
tara:strand:+ start:2488 stop:2766 length:279 start_codon:yes stop_codon:yes gene_type:complete